MGFVDAARLGAAAKLQQAVAGEMPTDMAERVQCKDLIRRALEKRLPAATTVRELREALATDGVRMKATVQNGGQLQAVVFEVDAYPGLHVKGSELAREYSGVGLRKTLEKQAKERAATMVEMPLQSVVPTAPEQAAVLPLAPSTAIALPESSLPVSRSVVENAPVEEGVGMVVDPTATGQLPDAQSPVPVPEALIPPAVTAAGALTGLHDASEPIADRSLSGQVSPVDLPVVVSTAEGVAELPLPAPDTAEVARQAELLRKAAEQATADALAGIRREWVYMDTLVQQVNQADREGDYARVAELRYGSILEVEERINAHKAQASATPEGRVLLDAMQKQEQERLLLAAQAEDDKQQQLKQQRLAEDAKRAAEATKADAERQANAVITAFKQAHQQVGEYRTQTDEARKQGDYALVGVLRGIITGAENNVKRCETELRKTLGVAGAMVHIEAQQKLQLEQAHAKYEREQLDELESFRRHRPYSGTHIRLQVPAEYLPTVRAAIGQRNHSEYEWQEHADKTISPRVVDGKVAINVHYEPDENDAKLDDALREFRKNGVEVFEQPTDRAKREEKAANARAFERQYAGKSGRSNALPEKQIGTAPPQIEM